MWSPRRTKVMCSLESTLNAVSCSFPRLATEVPYLLEMFTAGLNPSSQVARQSEEKTVSIFVARLSGRLGTSNAFPT